MFDKQGEKYEGHVVVLTGIENDRIYFIDPAHGAEENKEKLDFFFGMIERGTIGASAYMIAIKK